MASLGFTRRRTSCSRRGWTTPGDGSACLRQVSDRGGGHCGACVAPEVGADIQDDGTNTQQARRATGLELVHWRLLPVTGRGHQRNESAVAASLIAAPDTARATRGRQAVGPPAIRGRRPGAATALIAGAGPAWHNRRRPRPAGSPRSATGHCSRQHLRCAGDDIQTRRTARHHAQLLVSHGSRRALTAAALPPAAAARVLDQFGTRAGRQRETRHRRRRASARLDPCAPT
jgi:hypothetical protein